MTWRRTLSSGAVLSLLAMRPATPQSGTPEAQRWDRPEIGVNLALGLGRGQFHQFVKAAGGFGGDGAVPVPLHGGVGRRADPSGVFPGFESVRGPPALRSPTVIARLPARPHV